jgi:ribose transport system substrate-binding protein
MWKLRAKMLIPALIVMGVSGGSVFAVDKGIHDPTRTDYYEKIKGKRVVFVPVAMGFDLTEGWNALMQRQARELGYTVEVRIGARKRASGR